MASFKPKKKGPTADDVGVHMLEQLIAHSGKKSMKAMTPPDEGEDLQSPDEETKSGELDIGKLEELLGAQDDAGDIPSGDAASMGMTEEEHVAMKKKKYGR